MENSDIPELLDEVRETFERQRGEPEEGLDVDSREMLQLKKACRLIDAANELSGESGYYTLIVEASFAAIERTIQYYLINKGLLTEDEYVDHQIVYERGYEAGLYDDEFAGKLKNLWRNNRSDTYYRESVATGESASEILRLAEEIHRYVLQLESVDHECICDTA